MKPNVAVTINNSSMALIFVILSPPLQKKKHCFDNHLHVCMTTTSTASKALVQIKLQKEMVYM